MIESLSPTAGSCADWDVALARLGSEPDRLELRFQPIVDLKRGAVAGYEALSRFAGPPNAGPDAWFAAAAERGLGSVLDSMVIQRALSARRIIPQNCFLTVNVGPESLVDDGFLSRLEDQGSLGGLTIEVTEHESVRDYDRLLAAIRRLRALGAYFAVDDAGAGYSSLQHILAMRPEFVKIDRVFIDGIDRDPAKLALVEAVGSLVGKLDAWVIAEGIERPEELSELLRLGVPLAQGYLLARPAPAFEELSASAGSLLGARLQHMGKPVAWLTEPAPTVRMGDPALMDLERDFLVAVDVWSRPRMLHTPGMAPRELMRVSGESDPAGVLQRAMTRDAASRFDPLACIDDEGRFLGLVRIERLVTMVLAGRDDSGAPGMDQKVA